MRKLSPLAEPEQAISFFLQTTAMVTSELTGQQHSAALPTRGRVQSLPTTTSCRHKRTARSPGLTRAASRQAISLIKSMASLRPKSKLRTSSSEVSQQEVQSLPSSITMEGLPQQVLQERQTMRSHLTGTVRSEQPINKR